MGSRSSPIILDEAKYEEIVLVRNQKHYAPADVPADRASINTSLMTTASSEVFFARTVVLLEGEGDRAFFNTLLRRIKSKATVCPELAGLVFQITGGCTFFAPWLKLVRSYKRAGEEPFTCVWIMDGDAASEAAGRPVLRAARDCGFNLLPADSQAIVAFGDSNWDPATRHRDGAIVANDALNKFGGFLFCCDLEWALFNGASQGVVRNIKDALKAAGVDQTGDRVVLARRLGSRIQTGQSSENARKHPFIRALIAERIDLGAIPPEIFFALRRILVACYASESKVDALFRSCGIVAGEA